MMTMNKTFTFPKVAYTSSRRTNLPTIEMKLSYKDNNPSKPVLSIIGNLWNSEQTDTVIGGQCLDELAKFDELSCNPLFKKLYRLWKDWRLNDLKAGGPLQEAFLKNCKNHSYEERYAYLEASDLLYENGIKYGAQWWYHEIPKDDLKEIISLLSE